ncbi:MAG: restriction endonuclease subunit S [Cryobacterium sp.]|nr:restriction endonuclease subunit S [Cryobacterium sp.]
MTSVAPSSQEAWARVPLGEIVAINPRLNAPEPPGDSWASFIPMRCVEEESGRFASLGNRKVSEGRKGYTSFRDGDVLFAKVTPCMENGKAAVMHGLTNRVGFGSTEFFVLRPTERVDARYLFHFILQHDFRNQAARNMTGAVGLRRVPKSYFESQLIPLHSVHEQRRIVAEIEKHFTRLDAGVAALRRVQANLKRYRAAVLKAACEGRLVTTEADFAAIWPKVPHFETGEALLARIVAERRSQARSTHRSEEQPPPDISKLHQLPQGWVWTTVGQLRVFSLYGPRFSSDDYAPDGYLVLRTTDIRESGRVDTTRAPRLRLSSKDFEKYRVQPGDLLVTRTGSIGTLAVFNDEIDAIPGAYLIQFRLATEALTTRFLFYYLKSPSAQSYLSGKGAGVGRPNLNAPTIEALAVPLPPLAEQARIVAEVERRLSAYP